MNAQLAALFSATQAENREIDCNYQIDQWQHFSVYAKCKHTAISPLCCATTSIFFLGKNRFIVCGFRCRQ
jgi:hypothetical protein